jgi:hypothetical protein
VVPEFILRTREIKSQAPNPTSAAANCLESESAFEEVGLYLFRNSAFGSLVGAIPEEASVFTIICGVELHLDRPWY